MDVRTICLGILTGEATGYEKKDIRNRWLSAFRRGEFRLDLPGTEPFDRGKAGFGAAEAQEKRPDRKVYSITPEGRSAFLASLMQPLPEDRHRSAFVFAMLFSHLLPNNRVSTLLDTYIAQCEEKLSQLNEIKPEPQSAGEQFVIGLGQAIYEAMLTFIASNRAALEEPAAEAAE